MRQHRPRPAALQEMRLEPRPLRRRADHAGIGRVAPPQSRLRKAVIERVAVRQNDEGGAGRGLRDSLGGVREK